MVVLPCIFLCVHVCLLSGVAIGLFNQCIEGGSFKGKKDAATAHLTATWLMAAHLQQVEQAAHPGAVGTTLFPGCKPTPFIAYKPDTPDCRWLILASEGCLAFKL